ncbi:M48 family metalloprotease, partial [Limnoraphis robusta CCNP1324]|uniref:M48 family metalloprotease n=1 Tax=Limnoraphis robusta TaxID=1118279 RepID=UPI002B1EE97F
MQAVSHALRLAGAARLPRFRPGHHLPMLALVFGLALVAALLVTMPASYWIWISAAVVGVVALASGFKYLQVKRGGRAIAESLGGRLIPQSTTDFRERRLLNVVEEMAIASGIPVPPVYVVDESSINAFAAGFGPDDAVIGVNRGTIEHLNRDELQGVIGHELSHVLNGDSRI